LHRGLKELALELAQVLVPRVRKGFLGWEPEWGPQSVAGWLSL